MTLAQSLLGFCLLAAVLTVTPGLDTVFVLRQALRSGRGAAFAAGGGVCAGTLVWGSAAAAGVAALLVASQVAFTALRWAGIVWLPVHVWPGTPDQVDRHVSPPCDDRGRRSDGSPASDSTVRAMLITADAASGRACLIAVQTGDDAEEPLPGGMTLSVR